MDEDTIHSLRSIFQHKIELHPVWGNAEQREALKVFFGLDDEEIDDLNTLANFISNHGLERLLRK